MATISKARYLDSEPRPAVKLNSWKEIAAYLDRDPRTVQLWEKNEQLPVHRLTHRSRASVYAFTNEIDVWLQARSRAGAIERDPAPEAAPSPEMLLIPTASPAKRFGGTHPGRLAGIALAVAGLLAVGLWAVKVRSGPQATQRGMIVVLPFENQNSPDDLLVDGLTDSLIDDLGKSKGIQVISRRSVMPFKGRRLPLSQIAAELHAALALRGTAAKVGNEWRVTVELLDAIEDRHLWGATFTRPADEMLSREDELASTIASAVAIKLTGAAPPSVTDSATAANPRARQAYLTGRFYWNQRSQPDLQQAVSYFEQAIAIDPRYAPAYVGLADSYDLMSLGSLPAEEAFQRAKSAAQQALSIDPAAAEAYNALAMATYRQDWDFAAAERDFKRAIELDPNDSIAHQWYGEFLGDLRRFDQSIAELRRAKELDPLSPMVGCDLADGYLHAGRSAEAEAELHRIIDLYPDFVPAHSYLGSVLIEEAKFDQAMSEAQIYRQKTGDETMIQAVEIHGMTAAGKQEEARAEVRRLLSGKSGASFSSYQKAGLFAATGQTDAAYAALQDAYRERSWWLVTMLVDPGLDGIRSQARFQDLARRVGLPIDGYTGRSEPVVASR
jgi:TolB-like protein/lipopolysaccharide biosynthesis regulator YciM